MFGRKFVLSTWTFVAPSSDDCSAWATLLSAHARVDEHGSQSLYSDDAFLDRLLLSVWRDVNPDSDDPYDVLHPNLIAAFSGALGKAISTEVVTKILQSAISYLSDSPDQLHDGRTPSPGIEAARKSLLEPTPLESDHPPATWSLRWGLRVVYWHLLALDQDWVSQSFLQ